MQVCAQGPVRLILNQPKPVTFDAESACGASAQGALGGSQSGLEHERPDTGGAIPAKSQFNRIPDPDFAGMLCQHCFMDVGRDFQILGDAGSFVPVCSACARSKGRQDFAVSLQSTSRLKGDRTCNSHGCSQPCACFEEEVLSLNQSIREVLPSVPSFQQFEVLKVVEATQTFCCDCVGPALKHSASGGTSTVISGPKFFPLELVEESEPELLPTVTTPVVSPVLSSQTTRVAPSQCKSRRTRRRRQRTKRQDLSSDPILGLWRRVESLLSQCSQDSVS